MYTCFALYYFGNDIASTAAGLNQNGLGQRWLLFKSSIEWTLSGRWFYDYALGPIGANSVVVWVTLILFALGTISSMASRQLRSLPVAALALATLLTALQIKLTPPATAGWHYVSVYPFVTIVAAYGVFAGAKLLLRGDSRAHVAVACAVAAALAYDASGMVKYFHNLATSEPTNVGWSPAVYQLSRDLQRNNHPVFVADWGIVNPLFALHPSRRYTELAFQLETATPASLQQLGALLGSTPGPKLIVTHPPSRLVFPRVDRNLFAAIGRHLRPIATVDGHDGKPTYTIYTYR